MQDRTLNGFLILDDLLVCVTGESTNTARLPFDLKALYEFAKDLAEILKDGTIMEQKAILRSFVKRIIINPPDVTLEYTAPLLEEKEIGRTTETAVLPKVGTATIYFISKKRSLSLFIYLSIYLNLIK